MVLIGLAIGLSLAIAEAPLWAFYVALPVAAPVIVIELRRLGAESDRARSRDRT